MKDEGIGIHALQELEKRQLPPGVKLIDGGTSPDLIAFSGTGEKLIIVDAAKAGGQPGDIYRFKPEDLADEKPELASAHQMGVVENLALMDITGSKPKEVVIIGVEPEVIDWGMELSPKLQAALPRVVEVVMREVNTFLQV